MNKRREKHQNSERSSCQKPSGFYTPFEGLDQHLTPNFSNDSKRQRKHIPVPEVKEPDPPVNEPESEESVFQRAMDGVDPLAAKKAKTRVPVGRPEKHQPRFLVREEMEAYAQLVDLVAGEGPFELSYSDEYVDGAVLGISPEVLRKLRTGYFSYQDHLDLHHLTRQQAKTEVIDFITESYAARRRCVLIIPGRGLNSKDKEPVLKNSLVAWLTHAPLKRLVLAFASARSYDGGWGAFYVLIRRNEDKGPILTPAR